MIFEIGHKYSRSDIQNMLGVPAAKRKGDWSTGYTQYEEAFYVFANVGVAGRTGHDYANHWDGNKLVWYGKTEPTWSQPQIQRLISGDFPVFVFWRTADRDPFTFAGLAKYIAYSDTKPVKIVWQVGDLTPKGT